MNHEINGRTVADFYLDLCSICDYGRKPELLNACERTIFVTQELECEVNNGGFFQFFDNSSGQFSDEIVEAFIRIGAAKTAKICRKAVAAFGQALPVDWEKRRSLLDRIGDRAEAVLEECDTAFYACEEDLDALNAAYIRDHLEEFTLTVSDL